MLNIYYTVYRFHISHISPLSSKAGHFKMRRLFVFVLSLSKLSGVSELSVNCWRIDGGFCAEIKKQKYDDRCQEEGEYYPNTTCSVFDQCVGKDISVSQCCPPDDAYLDENDCPYLRTWWDDDTKTCRNREELEGKDCEDPPQTSTVEPTEHTPTTTFEPTDPTQTSTPSSDSGDDPCPYNDTHNEAQRMEFCVRKKHSCCYGINEDISIFFGVITVLTVILTVFTPVVLVLIPSSFSTGSNQGKGQTKAPKSIYN